MGSVFSKPKAPKPPPPPAAQAPIEEATIKLGDQNKTTEAIKAKAMGTKKLQVPLVNAKSGLGIPGM